MYERAALILDSDSESAALGDLSLSLITLGLRPLYTRELDELALLAREYRRQVGAVLLPGPDVAARLPKLRKLVLEPLGLPIAAVVPVGIDQAPELRTSGRDEGLRFCLPGSFEPHELRFVVSRVLSDTDPDELRLDPRVPCRIGVDVESEHRRVTARLDDLSLGGAFVVLDHPHAERSQLRLRFALLEAPSEVAARVAWRTGANAPAWRDRGMGVEFVGPDDGLRERLRRFVAEQTRRFRI
jgi:hypothetical protein